MPVSVADLLLPAYDPLPPLWDISAFFVDFGIGKWMLSLGVIALRNVSPL